jgi:hypothetical protein
MKGEKLLHVRADLKYPDKNVFVFENSDTFDVHLHNAIVEQRTIQNKEIY